MAAKTTPVSPAPVPATEGNTVPAVTKITPSAERAILFAMTRDDRTWAAQLRHILHSFAKQNPAPEGFVPTK